MSLYEAILEFERQQTEEMYAEVAKRIPELRDQILEMKDDGVEEFVDYCRVLLNIATQLGDSPVGEADLEDLAVDFNRMDVVIPETEKCDPKIISATRKAVGAYIQLYQQVLSQGGYANTYEEAVRRKFGSKEAYLEALSPILEATKINHDIVNELYPWSPIISQVNLVCYNALIHVVNGSIEELFPD